VDYDAGEDIEWLSPAGPGVRFPSGIRMLGATRDLIDWAVRRRVLAHPDIRAWREVDVTGLRLADGRVVGVQVEDRSGSTRQAEALGADLVLDAAGRASRAPQWLEAAGYPRPRETTLNGFLGYATRTVRPPAGLPDWKALYIQCAPPARRRGGVIKELAKANTRPWLLATGEDYRYTEVEGPAPGWKTRLAHRYLDRVIALATRSPGIRRKFMEVLHLVRSPASLFTPAILSRAILTRA
jgi:hypothetical protein